MTSVTDRVRSANPFGGGRSRQTGMSGHRLMIMANGHTEYTAEVDGNAEKHGGVFQSESNDSIIDQGDTTVIEGETGCATPDSGCYHGDTFLIEGNLTGLDVVPDDGVNAAVLVDGEQMTASRAVENISPPDPECTTNGDCGEGMECQNNECVEVESDPGPEPEPDPSGDGWLSDLTPMQIAALIAAVAVALSVLSGPGYTPGGANGASPN